MGLLAGPHTSAHPRLGLCPAWRFCLTPCSPLRPYGKWDLCRSFRNNLIYQLPISYLLSILSSRNNLRFPVKANSGPRFRRCILAPPLTLDVFCLLPSPAPTLLHFLLCPTYLWASYLQLPLLSSGRAQPLAGGWRGTEVRAPVSDAVHWATPLWFCTCFLTWVLCTGEGIALSVCALRFRYPLLASLNASYPFIKRAFIEFSSNHWVWMSFISPRGL